jgi:RimJ/RimL family protein N-acetyltransferase
MTRSGRDPDPAAAHCRRRVHQHAQDDDQQKSAAMPSYSGWNHMKLRKFVREDAPRVTELVSDYEVSRWTSNIPYPYTLRDAEQWIDSATPESARLPCAVEIDNEIVACVSCWPEESGGFEVGYWVGKSYWGRGIATAALNALLADCSFPESTRVVARVVEKNLASQRVLEKCGFSPIGTCTIDCKGESHAARIFARAIR